MRPRIVVRFASEEKNLPISGILTRVWALVAERNTGQLLSDFQCVNELRSYEYRQ
jgi:hypothetical protein